MIFNLLYAKRAGQEGDGAAECRMVGAACHCLYKIYKSVYTHLFKRTGGYAGKWLTRVASREGTRGQGWKEVLVNTLQ